MSLQMKSSVFFKSLAPIYLLLAMVVSGSGFAQGAAPGDIRYDREDKSEIESFPPSIFPHWIHRVRYRCDACHDSLFEMKLGGTPVSKDLMKEGKVCGACHNGKLAFPASFENCSRCHVATED